jgi:uncharacterized protein YgfB (UPF0149 family)
MKKIKRFLKGWGLSGARKKRKKEIQEGFQELEAMEESGSLNSD